MNPLCFRTSLALLITGLILSSTAFAHLMVAQQGTLNLSGNGAYLVASVAVSSLNGADDDGDGLLSAKELGAHAPSVAEQLRAGLQLSDEDGPRPLEDVKFALSPEDSQEGSPADQLIVMGRYALSNEGNPLTFRSELWGANESERSLSLTLTKDMEDEQLLTVTPQQPQASLYASFPTVLGSYLKLGMEHVLGGLDHLLFLMVVLSSGWGWKKVFTALSVFTLGHALSLVAVVFGGFTVSARVVEPAIAATIIGLALYDIWLARSGKRPPVSRLALVFGCSLIHGLGLGGALAELGVNPAQQGATLLGFNMGIELAQLSVAALALVGFALLRQLFGGRSVQTASVLMTFTAVVMGSVWFVERLLS